MSKEIAQTVGGKRIAWLIAIVAAFAVFATLGSQWRTSEAEGLTPDFDRYSAADAAALNQPDDKAINVGPAVGYSSVESTGLIDRLEGVVASFAQTVRNAMESGYTGDGITNAVSTSTSGTSSWLNALPGFSLLSSYLEIKTIDRSAGGSIKSSSAVIDEYARAVKFAHGQTVEYVDDLVIGSVTCDVTCITQEKNRADPAVEVDIRGIGYIIAIIDKHGNVTWFDDRFADSASIRGLTDTVGLHTWIASATADFWKNYQNDVLNAGVGGELDTGARPNSVSETLGPNGTSGEEIASMHAEKAGDNSASWLFAVLGLGALAFGIGGTAVARRSR